MASLLTALDYAIIAGYFAIVIAMALWFNRRRGDSASEFFLGGHRMPVWMVAISVVATAQSAATFLGGPDQGYRSNFSYLATNLGAVIATMLVAKWLMPRFFALNVSTVYELLDKRFGAAAKTQAGSMYLIGRVFAHGARLYMAGIALALMLFTDASTGKVMLAITLMSVIALAYTLKGGLRSVIYSDVLQFAVYVLAALATIAVLLTQLPMDLPTLFATLAEPSGQAPSKLTVFDFSLDFSPAGDFSFWASISGFALLHFAAYGLDQDMTQRVLACKDSKSAARAMLGSVLLITPVMIAFIFIGSLLYLFYRQSAQGFAGPEAEVFMHYILHEMPAGLRGLVVTGVLAACLSTLTSGYNSMASVLVADLYRPLRQRRGHRDSDRHEVIAGRIAMVLAAIALGLMAWLCLVLQRADNVPLLPFALGIMVFSYSGLLGVYGIALFSTRGNNRSVLAALIAGFLVTLLLQPFMAPLRAALLPAGWQDWQLGFPWQLCIGSTVAAAVCALGSPVRQSANDHNTTGVAASSPCPESMT